MTTGFALSLAVWAVVSMLPASISPSGGTFAAGGIARHELEVTSYRPALDDDVVASCRNCHRGNLSLAESEVDVLAAKIAAISRNEVEHVVSIPVLSEDDLLALARALAEPEGAQAH
ncbi:MAG: hypothetical protein PVH89_04660 [Gammaproteobacteria bacterium]